MITLDRPPLSVDDRAALAALVAHPTRPRPFAIDTDNRHDGQLPGIAEAVATETAYAITVADDVLALDLDDPDALPALDRLADELLADGWPVLRTESGREGHRHLWAVVTDPAAREHFTFRAVLLGLPVPRIVMRPPGTPHRHGLAVRLVDDPDAFRADVARVRALAAPEAPRERLDWRTLLASGCWPRGWTGADRSASAMVWQICIGAARAGLNLDDARRLLDDPSNLGGRGYRAKLARADKLRADSWLARYVWPSAAEAAARRADPPADAAEALDRLDAIAAAMAAHRWTGQAGATDRAVLAALVARGRARGSLTPTMSHREIAEAAPCHRNTVARSVARLADAGWLQTVERGRGRTVTEDGQHRERADATRWRLITRARLCDTGGTPPASTSLSGTSSRAAAFLDVCRWRGLGLNAPRVLDALADAELDARGLADRLGLNLGNLRYRLLPRLGAHGLIVRSGDRWSLSENLPAAMEAAAEAMGLTGKADAVAAAHAVERTGYLDHRERTRPDREAARRRRLARSVEARRPEPDPLPFDASASPHGPPAIVGEPMDPSTAPEVFASAAAPMDPLPPPDPVEPLSASLSGSGSGHAC